MRSVYMGSFEGQVRLQESIPRPHDLNKKLRLRDVNATVACGSSSGTGSHPLKDTLGLSSTLLVEECSLPIGTMPSTSVLVSQSVLYPTRFRHLGHKLVGSGCGRSLVHAGLRFALCG